MSKAEWEWFGSVGHLIVGRDCRFHMATLVGNYFVSTVGEYEPDSAVREIIAAAHGVGLEGKGDERRANYHKGIGFLSLDELGELFPADVRIAPETIGMDRTYETMVFKWTGERCDADGCSCGIPIPDWSEVDFDGYNDAGAATRGHYEMCEKYDGAE